MTRVRLATAAAAALLCVSAAQAKPVVFWANDPVGPDQTVQVLGSGLAGARVAVEPLAAGAASRQEVPALQAGNSALKFVIPATMQPGLYRYTLTTRQGAVSGVVNAPAVYWMQADGGDIARPGGWVSIFGRDIARRPDARIVLSARGRAPISLPAAAGADLWDARFILPATLPPGDWRVSVSNGDGGPEGWREAGVLHVAAAPPRPALTVDVRKIGAEGDGRTDDALAIQAALQRAANAGGGVVYLPSGVYHLKTALSVPPGVVLKGEGLALVSLAFSDFPTPPAALITLASDASLEDLSVFAGNYVHAISGGFPATPGGPRGHDIAIRRVLVRASVYRGRLTPDQTAARFKAQLRISTGGGDTLRLAGRNLVVEDCDLLGSGRALYLEAPTDARVVGNHLREGRYGWISISGADGVIFEDNVVEGADLQSTGGGINTLGSQPWSRNVVMKHNTFARLLGWDAEALTTDGPGGLYYGLARSLGPRTVALAGPAAARGLAASLGAGLFVTGGTGAGEYARLTSIDGPTLTLDRPLPVSLDATSIVTIAPFQAGYLILDNHFEDASVAAQVYGSSIDEVIAGNISARTSGFNDFGLVYHGVQPSWHTQLLGNQITQASLTASSAISVWGHEATPSHTPLNVGAVIRGNRLHANAYIHVWGGSAANPGVSDEIIEDNRIEHSDKAVVVEPAAVRVLVRHNVVTP